jgi:hypothetical protein
MAMALALALAMAVVLTFRRSSARPQCASNNLGCIYISIQTGKIRHRPHAISWHWHGCVFAELFQQGEICTVKHHSKIQFEDNQNPVLCFCFFFCFGYFFFCPFSKLEKCRPASESTTSFFAFVAPFCKFLFFYSYPIVFFSLYFYIRGFFEEVSVFFFFFLKK